MDPTAENAQAPGEKVEPPILDNADPDFGRAGTKVTFTGENLSGSKNIYWKSGSTERTSKPDVASSTTISGNVPQGMPQGDGLVWVETRGGPSNRLPFTFER